MRIEIERMLDLCPYTFAQLAEQNRQRDLVYWRNAIMYNLRKKRYTFQEIADTFERDHASVIHACNRVKESIDGFNNEQFKIYKFTNIRVPVEKIYCSQMRRANIIPSKVKKQATI